MHSVHYIRSGALGQIVQLTNHGSVLELALVVRGGIKVMMKKSLITPGNRLFIRPGNDTYILDCLMSKRWLHELILSVPLLLDVYPHIVIRVPLVL